MWEGPLEDSKLGRDWYNLDFDRAIKTIDGNDQATARSGVVANRSVEATEREVPKTKPADKKLGREKAAGLKISM